MNISLKDYFISLSSLLDFLEMELHSHPTNHCKRVGLMALRLGRIVGFSESELVALGALSLLHDLGASQAFLIQKMEKQKHPDVEIFPDHCQAGAHLIKGIPFLSVMSDVILYHHERYDGKGFYKKSDNIPPMSRIITLSDRIDMEIYNKKKSLGETVDLIRKETGHSFAPEIAEAGLELMGQCNIEALLSDETISDTLRDIFPAFDIEANEQDVLDMTAAFSTIVDAKSPFTRNHSSSLADKVVAMCGYYNFDHEKTFRMHIAANLHDIGKLSVPNRILDKNGKLTPEEFAVIRMHTAYTRQALSQISGWEDITDWASDHHEKLNGKGYPLGKTADELPFESRLMACLDIYQALTEDRPYKEGFSREKSFAILDECVERGEIDGTIVNDMKEFFG